MSSITLSGRPNTSPIRPTTGRVEDSTRGAARDLAAVSVEAALVEAATWEGEGAGGAVSAWVVGGGVWGRRKLGGGGGEGGGLGGGGGRGGGRGRRVRQHRFLRRRGRIWNH